MSAPEIIKLRISNPMLRAYPVYACPGEHSDLVYIPGSCCILAWK